jgi:hypothetical protein
MSNTLAEQAKSGFKTFIVTFGVSLLVFGVFYYIITDYSAQDINIEDTGDIIGHTKVTGSLAQDVQGVSNSEDESKSSETSSGTVNEEVASPFGELAQKEVNAEPRIVLAEATGQTTQTTQSTVPDTGITSITAGFLVSIILLSFFVYVVFVNPRKYALTKFEKEIRKDN